MARRHGCTTARHASPSAAAPSVANGPTRLKHSARKGAARQRSVQALTGSRQQWHLAARSRRPRVERTDSRWQARQVTQLDAAHGRVELAGLPASERDVSFAAKTWRFVLPARRRKRPKLLEQRSSAVQQAPGVRRAADARRRTERQAPAVFRAVFVALPPSAATARSGFAPLSPTAWQWQRAPVAAAAADTAVRVCSGGSAVAC